MAMTFMEGGTQADAKRKWSEVRKSHDTTKPTAICTHVESELVSVSTS